MSLTNATVTPWEVSSGSVDYDRLIEQFGTERIDQAMIDRIEKVTKKPAHIWLKRGIFFSHRGLTELLDAYEKGEKFYLYTGRGPSQGMHIGHLVPFMFAKYLQDAFDVFLVIQLSDDEKYFFQKQPDESKPLTPISEYTAMAYQNARDIIACGFDPNKTFIFLNSDYKNCPELNKLLNEMMARVAFKDLKAIFGFSESNTIGQITWPMYQSLPAFSQVFPTIFRIPNVRCLVPYAIDQDPYFRLARDLAPKLGLHKPYAIMSRFLPALFGSGKMSSSVKSEAESDGKSESSADVMANKKKTMVSPTIYLTDNVSEIRNKIKKYAFSGGGDTLELHRQNGANLTVDIAYQWLCYFEEDSAKLEHVRIEYGAGRMMTSEVKEMLADRVVAIVSKHQEMRGNISEDLMHKFLKC